MIIIGFFLMGLCAFISGMLLQRGLTEIRDARAQKEDIIYEDINGIDRNTGKPLLY